MTHFKRGLCAAVAIFALPMMANAATVTAGSGGIDGGFATGITYDDAAARGTSNNRGNPLNALGATNGTFFEIGLGSSATFTFGGPFTGDASIVEVTFGSRSNFLETADVFVDAGAGNVFVGSIDNSSATSTVSFGGGPFNTLTILDTTQTNLALGGFDIDSVRVNVAAVPVPAAGFLLLSALGGIAAMRRRNKS